MRKRASVQYRRASGRPPYERRLVKRDLARAVRFLVLPTISLVVVIAFLPGRVELAIRLYALVLCGVAIALVLAALRRTYPHETPLRPSTKRPVRVRRDVPGPLARLEDEAVLGVAGSFDLHHHLRPRLRGLASELLAVRRGVLLDADPERARRLLGDETWDLVRKDRPPPEDRLARGLPINEFRRVVESLERL
jgi:hypothetical protein